jgi:flagellar hook-associated protein 1 FlgK
MFAWFRRFKAAASRRLYPLNTDYKPERLARARRLIKKRLRLCRQFPSRRLLLLKSAFFEFTVANSALFTAKGALSTIAHNVANAATPGYSRQLVEQRASWPISLNNSKGMIGTGSEIFGVAQARNFYLDKKYWRNNSSLGEYTLKQTQLSLTETILNDMSGTGLKSQFNDFFSRIQELSKDAGDSTYRTNLIQLAASISTFFDNTYQQLQKQQTDINEEVKATTTVINSIARQIAIINKQVSQYELTGQRANDLRDQRALLVDQLSAYCNVSVDEREMNDDYAQGKFPAPEDRGKSVKVFTVIMNGHALVDGFDAYELEVRERKVTDQATGGTVYTNINPEDVSGLYDVYWKGDNAKFNMYSNNLTGQLKALIDMRDGNNQNYLSVKTGASLAGGVLTINLNPPDDRPDLSADGGILKITDNATGAVKEYPYKSYTFDPITNVGAFTLVDPANPAALPAGYEIKVGEASKYKGLPYYMSRLNDMARTIVQAMNTGTKFRDGAATYANFSAGTVGVTQPQIAGMSGGHLAGWNASFERNETLFFTYVDTTNGQEVKWDPSFDIYKVTAATIRVNNDLVKDPGLMQTSDEQTGGLSNNKVVLSMINISTDKGLFKEGTLGDYIIGVTGELGIEFKQTNNFAASYRDMTVSIDNQRMEVSGVNLDEEMTALMKYQQQYVAASKLINAIDLIYDLTVNRLGAF